MLLLQGIQNPTWDGSFLQILSLFWSKPGACCDSVKGGFMVRWMTVFILVFAGVFTGVFAQAEFRAYFSPKDVLDQQVLAEIQTARRSIDMSIYTFSSLKIRDELKAAKARGVQVRIVARKTIENPANPGFAKDLDAAGIEIRWISKINHHKFVIVDGEKLLNSSANFSETALQRSYDENLVVCTACPKEVAAFQTEFDFLFTNSNRLFLPNDVKVERLSVRAAPESEPVALMTSWNYRPKMNAKANRINLESVDDKKMGQVEGRLVLAMNSAQSSIRVATGHFRSWPLLEGMKRAVARGVKVELILDSQEYVSTYKQDAEEKEIQQCLSGKTKDELFCRRQGYHYSRRAAEAGVDVMFKFYALRWNFMQAPQMHNKFMIIDDREVYSGSYNWSFNAEYESTENVLYSKDAALVSSFLTAFHGLRSYGAGQFAGLRDNLKAETRELKFVVKPISLHYPEVDELRTIACQKCPEVFCSTLVDDERDGGGKGEDSDKATDSKPAKLGNSCQVTGVTP